MLTFLRVWNGYVGSNFDKAWCFDHFLMGKTLGEIRSIRSQLLEQLSRSGVEITSTDDDDAVLRSVAAGLAYNLLQFIGMHQYMGVERKISGTFIHPGSSVFRSQPQWMVSAEIVTTSKRYARMCSVVKPEWLHEIAPTSFMLGARTLHSYEGGNVALATCPLIYRRESTMTDPAIIATVPVLITVDEARDMQDARVEKARKDGLKLLKIQKITGRYGDELVGCQGSTQYRLLGTSLEIESGDQCYADVTEYSATLVYAELKFLVFEFPPAKSIPLLGDHAPKDVLSTVTVKADSGSLGHLLAGAVQRKAGAQ